MELEKVVENAIVRKDMRVFDAAIVTHIFLLSKRTRLLFYVKVKIGPKLIFYPNLACFDGCATGCSDELPTGCLACRSGYKKDEKLGCVGKFMFRNT
jgi:hypothetical protein